MARDLFAIGGAVAPGSQLVDAPRHGPRLCGARPDDAQRLPRHIRAQVRLAKRGDALLGPALAEAERAIAV
ncbi:MAG: hypothetical protein ACXWJ1_16790, partial [Caldimonas sp.]